MGELALQAPLAAHLVPDLVDEGAADEAGAHDADADGHVAKVEAARGWVGSGEGLEVRLRWLCGAAEGADWGRGSAEC
jgi:hypothetical protein